MNVLLGEINTTSDVMKWIASTWKLDLTIERELRIAKNILIQSLKWN